MTSSSGFDAILARISPALAVVLLSVISIWVAIGASANLNADATLYLVTADVYIQQGWEAAEALYRRPFYSVTIGWLGNFAGVSSLLAAQWLNTGLVALLGYAFVQLVAALGGSRAAQWYAVLLILIFPILASYKAYIIRDFGYWAFTLLSLVWLLNYQQRPNPLAAVGWMVSCVLATLFRPEAAFLILFMPLAMLWPCKGGRAPGWLACLGLYAAALGGLLLSLLAGALYGVDLIGGIDRVVWSEYTTDAQAALDLFRQSAATFATQVLHPYSQEYAEVGLLLTLFAILVNELIRAFPGLLWLIGIYLVSQRQLHWPRNPVYNLLHVVSAILLIAFLLRHQFMISRYLMLNLLLLLVPLATGLALVLKRGQRQMLPATVFVLLVISMVLDGHFSFSTYKREVPQSIAWLKQNTAPGDWVYASDQQLAYFSKRHFDMRHLRYANSEDSPVDPQILLGYDYLVIKVRHPDRPPTPLHQQLGFVFPVVTKIAGIKGSAYWIYRNENAAQHRQTDYWRETVGKGFVNPH